MSVTVSTSSDTVSAQTNTYAIGGGAQAVASPLVTLSTTAAGATDATYTASFTTSSTGALAADAGTITLAAPVGTIFSSNSAYTIADLTTATPVRVLQRGHEQRWGHGHPDRRLRHRGRRHGARHGQ